MTKVFISWSGNSEIPDMLKKSLVETFTENNLTVFVSTKNIRTGDEWFKVIKDAITESSITIVCITKDNIQSPWIYFESGAASFHNYLLNQTKPLMVVLFDAELPRNSPLNEYNHIKWGKEGYEKLLVDINSHMDAGKLQSNQISTMAKGSFPGLSRKIKRALKKSGSYDVNVAKQIEVYPDVVKEVVVDKLYLACPMASLDDDIQYQETQAVTAQVRDAISKYCNIPSNKIYAPAINIDKRDRFDGSEKAISDNFVELKKSEYYVCVYSKNVPSSIIVEIGYCIALKKNIVVFLKNDVELPYILKGSDQALSFIKIYRYSCAEDIIGIFKKNKKNTLKKVL